MGGTGMKKKKLYPLLIIILLLLSSNFISYNKEEVISNNEDEKRLENLNVAISNYRRWSFLEYKYALSYYNISTFITKYSHYEPAKGRSEDVDIGNRRQLFVDHKFVMKKRNVELRVHQPLKTGETSIQSDPGRELGSCSVLEKDDIYHMWYTSSLNSLAYASSLDGIRWNRPFFNLTTSEDFPKPNNIVLGKGAGGVESGGHMVFLDPNASEGQVFQLVSGLNKAIAIFSSPDGIHWKHTRSNVVTYDTISGPHHLDSQNIIFWDTRIEKYVTYVRKNAPKDTEYGWSQGRSVARNESENLSYLGHVNDLPVVIEAGGREDIYTSGVIQYPWADEVYFAFPTLYYHYSNWQSEFEMETPTNAGVLDTRFAVSRDGINWNNFNWHTFIPLGMEGEFDSKRIYMGYGMVPSLNGREIYMYYMGTNETHGWNRDDRNNRILVAAGVEPRPMQRAISRVVLRRDGFVSIHAPYEGGDFTTPPLRFKGDQLVLNIENRSTGELQVEILNENKIPIPGYSLVDSDIIHSTNEINRVVTWNGGSSVKRLEGKIVYLHFVLRDTDLYALQFQDQPTL